MSNPTLVDAVLLHSTGKGSRVHGPAHWAGVAAAGLTLLDSTPDADPRVVLLFSMFHDSMRQSDGHDPEHGARGAQLARRMRDAGEFKLDDARLLTLEEACISHDKGGTSMDPTIGVCWDADRLNLGRVGRKPDPALLSTSASRRITERAAGYFSLCPFDFDWRAIFRGYDALEDPATTVYLRFGDLPEDGYSSARMFGLRDPGVSVYPGSRLENGSYVLDFGRLLTGLDTRFLPWLLQQGRPLYVVEGRQVGIGGMAEPVLADARIVEEVPARSVGVLPDRPRFKALIEAWRAKREGRDPGYGAFIGAKEPDERRWRASGIAGGLSVLSEAVEPSKREHLKRWGLLEEYDSMKSKAKSAGIEHRSPTPTKPVQQREPLESFNSSPWKETPWK